MNRIVGLSQCNMNRSHAFKTCVLSVVVFNYRRILSTYDIHVTCNSMLFLSPRYNRFTGKIRKWIGLLVTGTNVLTLTCAEVIFKSCVSSVVETNYSRILSTYAIYIYFWLIRLLNVIEFWTVYIMVKIIW